MIILFYFSSFILFSENRLYIQNRAKLEKKKTDDRNGKGLGRKKKKTKKKWKNSKGEERQK